MTASVLGGPVTKFLTRDREGHRRYEVSHRVETTDVNDGPQIVMNTPGLPVIGAIWNFGNDSDVWAFCWPNMRVTIDQEREGDPTNQWQVAQIFDTRPLSRCQDETIEDPLLQAQKVSGTFTKYTKEMEFRKRDGTAIVNSAGDRIRGPDSEFDIGRPTVRIEQNVAILGLDVFSEMVDTVNNDTLWGLATRKIKLSNVTWERRFYGLCSCYFTRIFDFDIDFETFDRDHVDRGISVLSGQHNPTTGAWEDVNVGGSPPSVSSPSDFIYYPDLRGNLKEVELDGSGRPSDGTGTSPAIINIDYYPEKNFLLLGIPTDFSC